MLGGPGAPRAHWGARTRSLRELVPRATRRLDLGRRLIHETAFTYKSTATRAHGPPLGA